MNVGLWVWPAEPKAQRRVLRKVAKSEHLVAAMQAMAKNSDGLSNAQIDDALSDYSHWQTRWVMEQLISLGFSDYKVDFFGGPGKHVLTELGKSTLSTMTGRPVQMQTQVAPPPPPKPPTPPQVTSQAKLGPGPRP